MAYEFSNFAIESVTNLPGFNSVDGLNDIGKFFDYAIERSITVVAARKGIRFIGPEEEKKIVQNALFRYMKGEDNVFTSTDGLRNEMRKVGRDKMENMLINHMIEVHAFNTEGRRQLAPVDFEGQCASYITGMAYNGNLDNLDFKAWLKQDDVLTTLTTSYVQTKYKNDSNKQFMEQVGYSSPECTRAKEQLNLQMHLNSVKGVEDTGGYGGK